MNLWMTQVIANASKIASCTAAKLFPRERGSNIAIKMMMIKAIAAVIGVHAGICSTQTFRR